MRDCPYVTVTLFGETVNDIQAEAEDGEIVTLSFGTGYFRNVTIHLSHPDECDRILWAASAAKDYLSRKNQSVADVLAAQCSPEVRS